MSHQASGSGHRAERRRRVAGRLLCLVLCGVLFFPGGCGYRLYRGGENIDPSVRTVYVDTIANNTGEALVENYVRNDFIDQLRRSARFSIAGDRDSADAVLKGAIKSIVVTPLAADAANRATANRVAMVLELSLEERRGRKILYSNPALYGDQSYLVDPANPNRTSTHKTLALQKLSEYLAEIAVRGLLSGF